jgi:hypothetical protein
MEITDLRALKTTSCDFPLAVKSLSSHPLTGRE